MTNEPSGNQHNEPSREAQMDAALQSMTTWNGPQTRIWEEALNRVAAEDADASSGGLGRAFHQSMSTQQKWFAAAACVVLVATIGMLMMPAMGKARRAAQVAPESFALSKPDVQHRHEGVAERFSGLDRDFLGAMDTESMFIAMDKPVYAGLPALALMPDVVKSDSRLVERKVTMQLEVENARQAYLKARSLVSEASGEFVQGGRIDQHTNQPRADLVLRVQADRLEEVLMDLREIGEVKSEQVQAADVTEQMFDIEARLRNERQIEAELQQLLESRPNDKLEDILRVRHELGEVRQQIERLEASRSNLAQLVSLATITVLIVEEVTEEETEPEELGMWSQFKADLGDGLRTGFESLLGFFVWLAKVVVAGLPAWILISLVGLVAWRAYRRSNPKPLAV